jgi:hypothetical protein
MVAMNRPETPDINGALYAKNEITRMMSGYLASEDHDIKHSIQSLRDYLAALSVECPEECIGAWSDDIKEISDYLDTISGDLTRHREIAETQITISELLLSREDCYKTVEDFIQLAKQYPFYTRKANAFKKDLISNEMTKIQSMMVDEIKQSQKIIAAIERLQSFIDKEDSLEYRAGLELSILNKLSENIELHTEIAIAHKKLRQLIIEIGLNDNRKYAEEMAKERR